MIPSLILEWKDTYKVGDALIDAQHQMLFDLANQVLQSDAEDVLHVAVMRLFRYTREHFTAEEEIMAKRKYAGLPQQRAMHNTLLNRLSELANSSRSDTLKFTTEIHTLMVDWILKHILEEDIKIPRH